MTIEQRKIILVQMILATNDIGLLEKIEEVLNWHENVPVKSKKPKAK